MRLKEYEIIKLRELFVEVLYRNLRDKKNIAMMLSSGVDSRTVAALLKYAGFNNVTCVTVDTVESSNSLVLSTLLGYKHKVLEKLPEQKGKTKWICYKDQLKKYDVWVFGRGFNEIFKTNKRYKAPDINRLRERVKEYNEHIPYYAPLFDERIISFVDGVRGDKEINHFYTCRDLIKCTYPMLLDVPTNTGLSMRKPDIIHRGIKWGCKKAGVKLR